MICYFFVWGPPLTAVDFQNGAKLNDVSVTEETRKAIRAGIESEAFHKGGIVHMKGLLLVINFRTLSSG